MYSIFAGDICIYDSQSPLEEVKLTNPKLSIADNSAGSLTFTMPPQNAGYGIVEHLSTEIIVKKDSKEIWSGRVISENKDFLNQRQVTCEGELAYLNDTTQPPAEYHNISVRDFLSTLIDIHNEKATSDMQFKVGAVTVTDPNDSLYRYTNFESTLECIKSKLIDKLGGHIQIRKVDGVRYIDYLAEYIKVNNQTIEFGKNLVDFTASWDATELATVVVPLGKQLDESPIEALQAYLTVKDVNDGSIYVKSEDAVASYGWIETVVHWDDVSVADNLLKKAQDYLTNAQFESMSLELSAVDLHYLNPEIESLDLLDEVICISRPHGMDRRFPVSKMDIPIDKPEETIYTLGDKVTTSMSASVKKESQEIKDKIDQLPSESHTLRLAKENATEIINLKTRGYITITSDENGSNELIISDTQNLEEAKKMWVWNLGGLGYSKDGRETFDVAITMDGAIVANFITVGTLNADIIKAGKLEDRQSVNYWDMENGEFKLSATTKVGNSTIASASTVSSAVNAYDASLGQDKVFQKLVGGDYAQGIYLSGGKLYINGTYIQAGTIAADRLITTNITDVGTGVKFNNGAYFGGSIKTGKNAYVNGLLTANDDLHIKGSIRINGSSGKSAKLKIKNADDSERTLEFDSGLLIDY